MEKIRSSDAWGDEIEIKAMSELLAHPIEVVFANQQSQRYDRAQGNELPIKHFHVDASAAGNSANHYHFGLALPSGFTPPRGLALSEKDKLLKNGQLFNVIRKNKPLKEKLEKIRKHLNEGADVNARDANDKHNTPLHLAIVEGESELVTLLLDYGADRTVENDDHETPLIISERLGRYSIMAQLNQARSSAIKNPPITRNLPEGREKAGQDEAGQPLQPMRAWARDEISHAGILTDNRVCSISVAMISNSEKVKVQANSINVIGQQINNINAAGEGKNSQSMPFNDVAELGIDFENDFIGLENFFSSEQQVFHLTSQEDSLLGLIAVVRLFERKKQAMDPYAKENGHIFLKLGWLNKNNSGNLLEAFKRLEEKNLLVLRCHYPNRSEVDERELDTLLIQLWGILKSKQNTHKKMIFISETGKLEEKRIDAFFTDDSRKPHYIRESADNVKFSDLDYPSQRRIREKKVIFQGQELALVTLGNLLGIKGSGDLSAEAINRLDHILTSKVLMELITQEGIKVGSRPFDFSDVPSAYHKVYIKVDEARLQEIFYNENKDDYDVMAILGMSRDEMIQLLKKSAGNKPNEITEAQIKRKVRLWEESDSNQNEPIQFILLAPHSSAEKSWADFKQLCRAYPRKRIHFIEKQGDHLFWNSYYDPTFYIPRRFNHQIAIKKELLAQVAQGKLNDVNKTSTFSEETATRHAISLAISGTSEEELSTGFGVPKEAIGSKFAFHRPIVLLNPDPATAEKEFKALHGQSVHWLKVKRTEGEPLLIWHRSRGDLNPLRDYIDRATPNTDRLREAELAEFSDRVVIIADDPGMGKSTTLTYLSNSLLKQAMEWVIRVNLNDCKELIKGYDKPLDNLDEAIDFLSALNKCGLKPSLAKALLCYRLKEEGHISLLFDGFDEIDSSVQLNTLQSKIIRLLQLLQDHTRAKVWITTRRYKREALENALSTLATVFEEFSPDNQKEFLKQFWKTGLKLKRSQQYFLVNQPESQQLDNQLEEYAHTSLKKMSEVLHHEEEEFMGIPLQMRLLAEVFQERFEMFVNSEADTFEFQHMNVLDLYEHFVKKRYDIYFREKAKLHDRFSEYEKNAVTWSFTRDNRRLAFRFLFAESDPQYVQNILQGKLPSQKYQYTLNRVGIITQFQAGHIDFIHHTFAEYFAADLLAHLLRKIGNVYESVKKFLRKRFFESSHEMVRILFDRLLAKDSPPHGAALNGDKNSLGELDVNTRDPLGRIPLHLAASYGHKEVVAFLIQQDQSKNTLTVCDDFGLGLLSYALLASERAIFASIWKEATVDQKQMMVVAGDYAMFKEVVRRGDSRIVGFLLEKVMLEQKTALVNVMVTMVSADDYLVFKEIMRRWDSEDSYHMVRLLLGEATREQKAALVSVMMTVMVANDYAVFKEIMAMHPGNVDDYRMVNLLLAEATREQKTTLVSLMMTMVSADDYAVFKEIVRHRHGRMLESLLGEATREQKTALVSVMMIVVSEDDYAVFKEAMQRGTFNNYPIVQLPLKVATREQKTTLVNVMRTMMSGDDYPVFKEIVRHGDGLMINLLLREAMRNQKAALMSVMMTVVSANDHAVFKETVQGGDFDSCRMVNLLLEEATREQKAALVSVMMIVMSADNYAVFKDRVRCGNAGDAAMVECFLREATREQKAVLVSVMMTVVSADNYAVFKEIVRQRNYDMVELLLREATREHKTALVSVMMTVVSADEYAVFKEAMQFNERIVQLALEYSNAEQRQAMWKAYMAFVDSFYLDLAHKLKTQFLRRAVRSGYLEVVNFCLDQGADVLERNHHDTLLHKAVSGNNVAIIRLILEAIKAKCKNDQRELYISINAPDKEGDSPLMWAAKMGKIEAAQLLLSYGVDINARNNDGMTALDWSIRNGHLDIKIILLEHNDIKLEPLNEAQKANKGGHRV